MQKGRGYHIHISFGTLLTRTYTVAGATAFDAGGLRAGGHRKIDRRTEMERAVALAKRADHVVLCVGLNGDWESEGYDRSTVDLPPGSDELVRAVTEANENTAVVIQSGKRSASSKYCATNPPPVGTPVTMPWRSMTPSLVQAWYGGNETGNAIADVLFGATNPSGKLPRTFPLRNEDNPAFLNFRSERGRTVYGKGVYIGYRYYEKAKREVAFPFGHGLSYTGFSFEGFELKEEREENVVTVDVLNCGERDGAQVVQVYIAQENPSVGRPIKELKGFTKVFVPAGQRKKTEVRMQRKYANSFWDEEAEAWVEERGSYKVLLGDSSATATVMGEFMIEETKWWRGL